MRPLIKIRKQKENSSTGRCSGQDARGPLRLRSGQAFDSAGSARSALPAALRMTNVGRDRDQGSYAHEIRPASSANSRHFQ